MYKLYDAALSLKVRWQEVDWPDMPKSIECGLITAFEAKFGERPLANERGCSLVTAVQRLQ